MTAKISSTAGGTKVVIGVNAEGAMQIDSATKLITAMPPYTFEGGGAVESVNGQTGAVVLGAADVGAPTTGGTGATGLWPINITGVLLSDAPETGILNAAGTSWRLRIDGSNNLNVNSQCAADSLRVRRAGEGQIHWDVNSGYDYCNGSSRGFYSAVGCNVFANTSNGDWTASGNVIAYSDARLKKDWKPVADSFVERVAGLTVGTYTRSDADAEYRQAGVIAQEVQEFLPEAVISTNDNAFGEGDHTLGLNYGGFSAVSVVMLAREVMALRAEIKQLKQRIEHGNSA